MNELRQLRRSTGLGQREFAALISVPLETFRTWDSGRRPGPASLHQRAVAAVAHRARQDELLSLDVLAAEFGIHQRTLRDAVRAGRLAVDFSTRSAFGRPIRLTTRSAVRAYKEQYYRRLYSRPGSRERARHVQVGRSAQLMGRGDNDNWYRNDIHAWRRTPMKEQR